MCQLNRTPRGSGLILGSCSDDSVMVNVFSGFLYYFQGLDQDRGLWNRKRDIIYKPYLNAIQVKDKKVLSDRGN